MTTEGATGNQTNEKKNKGSYQHKRNLNIKSKE